MDDVGLCVHYDASCALCRASRRWVERRDRTGRIAFRDLTGHAGPATGRGGEMSLLVVTSAGTALRGYDGWVRILAELPRWGFLSDVASRPPIRWAGTRAYRVVARLRHGPGRLRERAAEPRSSRD